MSQDHFNKSIEATKKELEGGTKATIGICLLSRELDKPVAYDLVREAIKYISFLNRFWVTLVTLDDMKNIMDDRTAADLTKTLIDLYDTKEEARQRVSILTELLRDVRKTQHP